MTLGLVAVVVAEGGEEGNAREQRLVGLEELRTPIFVAGAGVTKAEARARGYLRRRYRPS